MRRWYFINWINKDNCDFFLETFICRDNLNISGLSFDKKNIRSFIIYNAALSNYSFAYNGFGVVVNNRLVFMNLTR